jgi:hypothetical protein
LASFSLLLPAAITFDAWGWLVWGRQVVHLDLDTTGGPSWKPLPVVVTAILAPFGDLAPPLWLVVARTWGLLCLVAVYRLGARLAGWLAGAVAVGFMLLTPDSESRFLRLFAEGHTAPLEAALLLWAIERVVARRDAQALWLGAALALLRPEAWPFLLAFTAWLWWRRPALRRQAVLAWALVAVLWFGGDWWGAGSPWHGADMAQVAAGDSGSRLGIALGRVGRLVILPVWFAAAFAVVFAIRRRDRLALALAAAALGWTAIVVLMSVALHYAALSRFLVPAAALVCVLAGAGVARMVDLAPSGALRAAVAVAIAVAVVPFGALRVQRFAQAGDVGTRADLERDLDVAVARAGGDATVRSCGRVAVEPAVIAINVRPALAWKLDVPLDTASPDLIGPAIAFVLAGGPEDARLGAGPAATVRPLARSSKWAVYALDCTPAA